MGSRYLQYTPGVSPKNILYNLAIEWMKNAVVSHKIDSKNIFCWLDFKQSGTSSFIAIPWQYLPLSSQGNCCSQRSEVATAEAVQRFVLSSPFPYSCGGAADDGNSQEIGTPKAVYTSANPIYIFIENVTLLCPKADTVRGCKVLNGYCDYQIL